MPGRIFKTEKGRTVGATYELNSKLERSEIHYRERRLLRVHQTPVAIEAFWSWSHPDYPQLLECFRTNASSCLQNRGYSDMEVSEYAAQVQHFASHRELQAVPKEPVEDQQSILYMVDYYFRCTRHEDNDYRDYDPLNRRILRWAAGQATSATYQIKPQERHLDRIDVAYKDRYLYSIHQENHTVDYLDTFLSKDGQNRMECWHLDLDNPDKSYYQCL